LKKLYGENLSKTNIRKLERVTETSSAIHTSNLKTVMNLNKDVSNTGCFNTEGAGGVRVSKSSNRYVRDQTYGNARLLDIWDDEVDDIISFSGHHQGCTNQV
jgi:hypothetical protein